MKIQSLPDVERINYPLVEYPKRVRAKKAVQAIYTLLVISKNCYTKPFAVLLLLLLLIPNFRMKVLLDIEDDKADFVLELLQHFTFVKAEPIANTKADFLNDLKGSIDEVILAKQGKIKLQSARKFISEI